MKLINADELIEKYGGWYTEEGTEEGFIGTIESLINAIPSVQPERKTGKWIWSSSTSDRIPCEMRFWCSNCRHETITHGQEPWEKFCPNCGANMGAV